MSKSPSVRGALAWSFAERYLSLLITVPTTMILARLLTPTQVGAVSYTHLTLPTICSV